MLVNAPIHGKHNDASPNSTASCTYAWVPVITFFCTGGDGIIRQTTVATYKWLNFKYLISWH